MEIIKVNSRMPDVLEGDVWAAISSVRIGARRIGELAAKYGVETFEAAVADFMDFGEAVSRASLKDLPKGTFELDEEQDDGPDLQRQDHHRRGPLPRGPARQPRPVGRSPPTPAATG